MARALANHARTIRLPVHIELLLDHPVDELEHIERMSRRPVLLDAPPMPGGGGTVEDIVKDAEPLPGAGLRAAPRAPEDLAGVLRDLPDTERDVSRFRFGLSGEEPMTFEAVGRKLGVTRERVRQIEAAAPSDCGVSWPAGAWRRRTFSERC